MLVFDHSISALIVYIHVVSVLKLPGQFEQNNKNIAIKNTIHNIKDGSKKTEWQQL